MFFAVVVQGLVVIAMAMGLSLRMNMAAGAAVMYGGAAAMIGSGLLWWRFRRGEGDYHCDAGRHLRSFYRSSLERFFVVGTMLALGFGGLKLAALPVLAGFVVGLLAWVIAAAARK
jgi:ATP synthase I chain